MIKILISVYIVAVLLIAGFAEASTIEAAPLKFDRMNDSQKIWLNIADARFDSRREVLTLSGQTSSECRINPEVQLDERTNNVLVSVTATGSECRANINTHYEIVIDIKAFFAENAIDNDSMVHFQIDNYTGGEAYEFNYSAKKQTPYTFNTKAEGKIEFDHRTQKFYLVNEESKIQILSRFNLNAYADQFVQLSGLTPSGITIGDNASETASQLFINKLVAIR